MKLVKHQLNGGEHVVLRENAALGDVHAEAKRLREQLGYHAEFNERAGHYLVTHPFFRGQFVVRLDPD